MSVVSAKKVKAGGNWKKLQKTLVNEEGNSGSKVHRRPSSSILNGGKGKHKAVLEVDSRDSSSSPAPSELPWFAEDLSPEDLALVRSNSGRRSTGSTQAAASATTTATASSSSTQSADDGRKRQIILGGGDGLSAEKKEPGTYVAIDCEMVGVGPEGSESVLARVSIVNWHGALLLDTFVQPKEKVTDYRTWVSGVRAEDLQTAPPFEEVQKQVAKLIKGRVLVGHAIHNDLNALLLSHPKPLTRDTAQNKLCRELAKTKHPSLKKLVALRLGIDIQLPGGGHSSLEDARATMALYRTLHADWQKTIHSSGAPNAIIGRGWKKRKSVDSSTPRSTKAAKTEEDPEWWKHL